MTYRRWSSNTASLGMALVTLAMVALGCALAVPMHSGEGYIEYADRMPVVFNAVLFALWIMIALWSWLSRFWDQQLLDGIPWTTAGRMIPYAERVAFMLTAVAVLTVFQMALWPARPIASGADDSATRMICGLSVILLLALQNIRAAKRNDSTTIATMAVALIGGALLFAYIRLPASDLKGQFSQYTSVILAVAAMPILVVAEALPKSAWRAFAPPLWFLALLILPMQALLELLSAQRLPSEWVKPATLALLAVVYSYAGSREHRRWFLLLGGILLLAAGTSLYRIL